VGSATVAGLTTAGIIAPLVSGGDVDPNLLVLAIGAGSLMFSHFNDAGFWMFKEYFNVSIKDTIRSWSLMESIVAFVGLGGVMLLDLIL
jgi:Gnt-I system high-affinity gluconate transporter